MPDVKINILPAADVHIHKARRLLLLWDQVIVVHETPGPYAPLHALSGRTFTPSPPHARNDTSSPAYVLPQLTIVSMLRVDNILSGVSEAEKVLHRDTSPKLGYVLPDMNLAQHSQPVRSAQGTPRDAVEYPRGRGTDRAGEVESGPRLAADVHHFHVHVVNANYHGLFGMSLGQVHLLDGIIALLELDADDDSSIYERVMLTYALREQHVLYTRMKAAQSELDI
ncbi:hypothetical protein OBBRIDRAFT_837669 [Obba rivulosa]|uniref:Uncharacterized protein n=1 Tax=Obba rivulosa TaxID=1052685 RepID=A0A8E2APL2_9APHY|nr:hypothetical protein OBBRIDRAFT_837669 [Obba rivulosa]